MIPKIFLFHLSLYSFLELLNLSSFMSLLLDQSQVNKI